MGHLTVELATCWEFDHNFSKKSNAPGFPGGGDGRSWILLIHKLFPFQKCDDANNIYFKNKGCKQTSLIKDCRFETRCHAKERIHFQMIRNSRLIAPLCFFFFIEYSVFELLQKAQVSLTQSHNITRRCYPLQDAAGVNHFNSIQSVIIHHANQVFLK